MVSFLSIYDLEQLSAVLELLLVLGLQLGHVVLDGHSFVLQDGNVGILFLHDLALVPEHLELILLLLILTHDDIQLLLRCSVMFLQDSDILTDILLLLRLLLELLLGTDLILLGHKGFDLADGAGHLLPDLRFVTLVLFDFTQGVGFEFWLAQAVDDLVAYFCHGILHQRLRQPTPTFPTLGFELAGNIGHGGDIHLCDEHGLLVHAEHAACSDLCLPHRFLLF